MVAQLSVIDEEEDFDDFAFVRLRALCAEPFRRNHFFGCDICLTLLGEELWYGVMFPPRWFKGMGHGDMVCESSICAESGSKSLERDCE